MTSIMTGLLALFAAAALVILLVAAPRSATASGAERLRAWGQHASARADDAVRKRAGETVGMLDLAGVRASPGTVVLIVTLLAAGAAVLGVLIALGRGSLAAWALPLLLPVTVLIGARLLLSRRVEQRRRAFADQLEGTLQLLASGLRAGHSLQRAMDSVARDSARPTTEEFSRVVNEHRLGRDLSDALTATAERMKSDDLAWTAQAMAIHREVGGNLGEVLDHIAETIRERQQIRRQVATLSAEGRVSATVLMVLPLAIALVLSIASPGYLTVFVSTPLGIVMLVLCLALFIAGSLWLRAITRIRF